MTGVSMLQANAEPLGRLTPAMRRLIQLALVATLLPYIGIGLLPTDTQPFAFMACAVGVAVLVVRNEFRLPHVTLPVWMMAVCATISIPLRVVFDGQDMGWLLRAYFGYVSAPIVLTFFIYYLRFLSSEEIAKVIDAALWITFFGFVLNVIGLTDLIQLFVNRGIYEETRGARGMTSFFAEQSRVSEQMAAFFFAYLLTGTLTRRRTIAVTVAAILSAAGQMFIVAAEIILAYVIAFTLLTVVRGWIALSLAKRLAVLAALLAGFFAFQQQITQQLIRVGFPTRGITAIAQIARFGLAYVGQDAGIMVKISGTMHAAATLADNPLNFELATAGDPEYRSTIRDAYSSMAMALFKSKHLTFPRRPYSALGNWIIDFGVVGLLSAIALAAMLIMTAWRVERGRQLRVLWASLFLMQAFLIKIALVNPTIWLLAAIIWRCGDGAPAVQRVRAPSVAPSPLTPAAAGMTG